MAHDDLLTIDEAAELAQVSRNSILAWMQTGKVTATKNKFHVWQIPKADVLTNITRRAAHQKKLYLATVLDANGADQLEQPRASNCFVKLSISIKQLAMDSTTAGGRMVWEIWTIQDGKKQYLQRGYTQKSMAGKGIYRHLPLDVSM